MFFVPGSQFLIDIKITKYIFRSFIQSSMAALIGIALFILIGF